MAVRSLVVPAHAKVNLGLEVLGPREDGYHELRTIFQTVALHDDVELRATRSGITLTCDAPGVPADERNLAWKAADALRRHARIQSGVAIHITKRIPAGGGLGGGSSDAAAVLVGLDQLWRLGLGPPGLHPLARRLGADVPFFLLGGTALGLGRGDETYPLLRQVRAHVVLVDPGRPVSTAAVFRRLDTRLTPREDSHTIFRFVSRDVCGAEAFPILVNDLEPFALEEAPELTERVAMIRGILDRERPLLASLSGSGSTYFGLFDDPQRAGRARDALKRRGFAAWRVRTLSLGQYRASLARALARDGARGQGRSAHHGDHRRQGHPGRRREAQGVRLHRV